MLLLKVSNTWDLRPELEGKNISLLNSGVYSPLFIICKCIRYLVIFFLFFDLIWCCFFVYYINSIPNCIITTCDTHQTVALGFYPITEMLFSFSHRLYFAVYCHQLFAFIIKTQYLLLGCYVRNNKSPPAAQKAYSLPFL